MPVKYRASQTFINVFISTGVTFFVIIENVSGCQCFSEVRDGNGLSKYTRARFTTTTKIH